MKKAIKKTLAAIITVVMIMTVIPLNGIANMDWSSLLSVKASAATNKVSISSVDIDDVVCIKNGTGYSHYDYDEDNEICNEWFEYDIVPEHVKITLSNGDVLDFNSKDYSANSMSISSTLRLEYSIDYFAQFTSNQNIDDQWGVGTHKAYLTFSVNENVVESYSYNVKVIDESPILSVSASDVTAVISNYGYPHVSSLSLPSEITVRYKDGNSKTYNVQNEEYSDSGLYLCNLGCNEEISKAGTYTGYATIEGFKFSYTIRAINNPVVNVTADKLVLIKGLSRTNYDGDYDLYPRALNVKLSDGSTYKVGGEYDTNYELEKKLCGFFSPSLDNYFTLNDESPTGTYTGYLEYKGIRYPYTIELIDTPIASISVSDRFLTSDEANFCDDHSFFDYNYYEYNPSDKNLDDITVHLKNGRNVNINDFIELYPGVDYTYRSVSWDDYKYNPDAIEWWNAGTYNFHGSILGQPIICKYIITEGEIQSVNIEDVILLKGVTGYCYDPGNFDYDVMPQKFIINYRNGEKEECDYFTLLKTLGIHKHMPTCYAYELDSNSPIGKYQAEIRIVNNITLRYNAIVKEPTAEQKIVNLEIFPGQEFIYTLTNAKGEKTAHRIVDFTGRTSRPGAAIMLFKDDEGQVFTCSLDCSYNAMREQTASMYGLISNMIDGNVFYHAVISCASCYGFADIRPHCNCTENIINNEGVIEEGWTHLFAKIVSKSPSCKEEGIALYFCGCGYQYTESIKKTSHSYGSWITDRAPTATVDGTKHRLCSVCGNRENGTIPATGEVHTHSYTSKVTTPATCTANGVRTYTCSCGDSYTETITKTGHSLSHMVIPATCTVNGMEYDICANCGSTFNSSVIAKGHKFNHVKNDSTCTKTGTEYDLCSVCGAKANEKTIALKAHTYKHMTVPSTCSIAGMEYDICTVCGATANSKTLPLKAHTWGAWTRTVEPTTTAEGKEVRKCSVCGKEESRAVEKLKVLVDKNSGVEIVYDDEYSSGVKIEVSEVFDGTSFQLINSNYGNVSSAIFDISTTKDGKKVQPNGEVKVRIPVPADFKGGSIFAVYVDSEKGTVTQIPVKVDGGYAEFTVSHFSKYALVYSKGGLKSVSINDMKLKYKDTAKLNPKIEADSGVKYTVTYKSSDSKVATVDKNGNVKGTKGWINKSATITCTVTDEFGNAVTDTCKVTCGYAWWQWIVGTILFGFIWY